MENLNIEALEIRKQISSTNLYLINKAKTSSARIWHNYYCLANTQTAGSGRGGKSWQSPEGNIYLSRLSTYSHDANLGPLSLVVGISIIKTLISLGVSNLKLKWPNDVLYKGKKLVGILIDCIHDQSKSLLHVIIGMGINVLVAPFGVNSCCLKDLKVETLDQGFIVNRLIFNLEQDLPLYKQKGFVEFKSLWQAYDFLAGKDIIIHLANNQVKGKYLGITDNGLLNLIDDIGAIREFSAGEVTVRIDKI